MIGTILGLAVAAGLARYLIRAPVKVALGVLLATTFLIPGTVLAPGSSSGYTTIHRIVLGIFILNVLRGIARREISADVLKLGKLSLALFAWVVMTFIVGVALADTSYAVGAATFLWVFIVEYALFFVFVVAAIRAIGDPWWVARLVAILFLMTGGISVYEHFSGRSFGRWLAQLIRGGGYLGVRELGVRGRDVRVQGGSDFSLAFAWTATMLLPIVVVVATRARNIVMRFVPALIVLSIAWTYARSAYVGVVVVGAMLLILSRFDRRITSFVLAGVVAALLFSVGTQAFQRTFGAAEGSTLVREERLPLVLTSAAEDPLTGRGLLSLSASGIRTTDSLFLLTYAEIGVLGASGLVFLLMAAIAWIAPGVRAPPPDGLLGAACLCAIVMGIVSAVFLDSFNVSGVSRAFWLAAAIGSVVAERVQPEAIRRRRVFLRALLPAGGVVAGLILLAVTPATAAATLRFTTISSATETVRQGPDDFTGRLLINTSCEIIEARVGAFGQKAKCYDTLSETGIGDFRIEADDATSLDRALTVAVTVVRRRVPSVRFFLLSSDDKVRPTYVKTAPVWLGLAGLAIAFLVPPLPPFDARAPRSDMSRSLPFPFSPYPGAIMPPTHHRELPAVSVVIPVRNRPQGIRACLDSLLALDYPRDRLEIVVIDDASTDDTPSVVASYGREALKLIVQEVNRGQSECRNVGARASTGEVVAFIDSDCIADTEWLRNLVQDLNEPAVVAAGGSVRESSPNGWIKRYEASVSPLHMGDTPARVVPGSQVDFLPSCNVVVRRRTFFDAGGFDASLRFGEDVDLIWRLCRLGEVRYRPSGVVWHDHRGSLWAFLRNRIRYATAQGVFLSRFPANQRLLDAPAGMVLGSVAGIGLSFIHPAYLLVALAPPILEVAVARLGARASTSAGDAVRGVITGYASSAYRAVSHAGRHYALPLGAISASLALVWPGWVAGEVIASGSLVAPAVVEWFRRRPRLDPLRFVAVFVLDSLAVGIGTLAGCIRYRTMRPLALAIRLHASAGDVPPTRSALPRRETSLSHDE